LKFKEYRHIINHRVINRIALSTILKGQIKNYTNYYIKLFCKN